MLRQELRVKFIEELSPPEKAFFLKTAREAIALKGYRPSEDLFHYCYFLTLRERLKGIIPGREEGGLRFLVVEGMRDVEDAVRLYRERLESTGSSPPEENGAGFIEYLSG